MEVCPARHILQHYNDHVSANHLDVGVGTGYFLDRCRFGTPSPRIALMDLNQNCLDAAARQIARYDPVLSLGNALEPFTVEGPMFDSVGLNYLLHCLPGDIRAKSVVFQHAKAAAVPGATIFGATLLHGGVDRNWMARKVMDRNNAHGIFSNAHDDLDGLRWALSTPHRPDRQHRRLRRVVLRDSVNWHFGHAVDGSVSRMVRPSRSRGSCSPSSRW